MQDCQLIEKLAHRNRERIPERAVHGQRWGAHGALGAADAERDMRGFAL